MTDLCSSNSKLTYRHGYAKNSVVKQLFSKTIELFVFQMNLKFDGFWKIHIEVDIGKTISLNWRGKMCTHIHSSNNYCYFIKNEHFIVCTTLIHLIFFCRVILQVLWLVNYMKFFAEQWNVWNYFVSLYL